MIKLIYKDHVILSNFSEICYLKIKMIELIYSVILSNLSMGWLYNIDTWYVFLSILKSSFLLSLITMNQGRFFSYYYTEND